MKYLFASLLIASLAGAGFAHAQQPAARATAKKAAPAKKAHATSRRQAIEEAIPTEDADPSDKLNAVELAVAKRVYVGVIPCELGAKVTIKQRRREGYFLVSHGLSHFVMHPVESRTGAIRLEDPARGALWLQLGNKSMLMSQKEGKRLADECQSPQQLQFAQEMKNRPPVNILEPAPAAPATPTTAVAPAAAATPATPDAPAATAAPGAPAPAR